MCKPRFCTSTTRKARVSDKQTCPPPEALILLFWLGKSQTVFVAPTVSNDGHRRSSRWDRWSLSRAKKDKVASQPNLPASLRGEGVVIVNQPYMLSESGKSMPFSVREGERRVCSLLFCLRYKVFIVAGSPSILKAPAWKCFFSHFCFCHLELYR